ncbi:MAG: GH3 auxin-responsive promoter family protein [Muribaculaceae bacterium]|nr:GH3 auxin-responsive promoter family protein [Muribaculaceae bacterium]
MAFDFTPLIRPYFIRRAARTDSWQHLTPQIQRDQLKWLLHKARRTLVGQRYQFETLSKLADPYESFRRTVPVVSYEEIRPLAMRMIKGEKDILWPGVCRNFAQSSGTSGGKSKYIPVTDDSLTKNHYSGSADVVANYLRRNPSSKMFSGKGFILGGSFANELNIADPKIKVGDLSATLIDRMPSLAEAIRIPDKKTALLADWDLKLPRLAETAMRTNVTNISGVPSWFLVVLKEILRISGKSTLQDIWPNFEVFFHGGISFAPYRNEYLKITDPEKMHFVETYNASEGFFATQSDFSRSSLLLLIDNGIFYEFAEPETPDALIPISDVVPGKIYELIITSPNGLWRYRLGDTVKIESTNPVTITVAGRTKSFINAFGEELMENNAEAAIARTCEILGASIANYTAAPIYTEGGKRGRHQWLIEWHVPPRSLDEFSSILDTELRRLNSDYDAKRTGDIFLDSPAIVTAKKGIFDQWLRSAGTHKLGGQRKVPRLSNTRDIIEAILPLNK